MPLTRAQTVKKRRGVETYKFFQNWLRVIFQWWGAFICTVHPARGLVEFGLKNFSTEIRWEIFKKKLVRKSHGKFQKVKNLVKSKFQKARIWPNFSAISRKKSWVILSMVKLQRSNGNVQAVGPLRSSPCGSPQRFIKSLNHHVDFCRRTRD